MRIEDAVHAVTSPIQISERRARRSEGRRARHRGREQGQSFARGFAALGELALDGVQVSARVVDLASGGVVFTVDDHVVMPTASIGKVLLLVEVAARMDAEPAAGLTLVDRTLADAVGGAGIWQHLEAPSLPVADLGALVGATSDSLATNVLLRHIGLEAVTTRTEALGLKRTALLDLARDHRGPDDAPQLSVGSARELTWLFGALARGEVVNEAVSQRVIAWLSLNADLSLVASAFGANPLAHRNREHGILLVNKTGSDGGVRSDVGVVRGPRGGLVYAVSTYFDDADLTTRLAVIEGMRTIGLDVLEYVH